MCSTCHLREIKTTDTALTCAHCAVSFSLPKGEADKRARRYGRAYCSRSCAASSRAQPKDRGTCAHCGTALLGKDQKIYCGRTCYDASRRGPDHDSAYQGQFLHLRTQVLLRDGRQCAMSGATRALEIHHINHDPADNVPDNLITLSKASHKQYHALPDAPRELWRRVFSQLVRSRT